MDADPSERDLVMQFFDEFFFLNCSGKTVQNDILQILFLCIGKFYSVFLFEVPQYTFDEFVLINKGQIEMAAAAEPFYVLGFGKDRLDLFRHVACFESVHADTAVKIRLCEKVNKTILA